MIDRSYQPQLIQAARLKLREITQRLTEQGITRKPRLMVQLAAGGGKTRLSGMIAERVIANGGSVAFLCDRGYLLDQTSLTYKAMGIRHSFLAAGRPLNPSPSMKTYIGMMGSMRKRQPLINAPTHCFVDEAHHSVAKSWKAVIEAWPNTTFIMLSATPGARSDGRGLEEICDDIVCGPQISELIAIGALSDFRWLQGVPPAELLNLRKIAGEYSAGQQAEILDKPVIIGNLVDTYRKHVMGKTAAYFLPNVKTSEDTAEAFRSAGLPFAHMDAETPEWKRKQIAKALARGELLGATNVNLMGEGYDLAAQAGMDVTIEVTGLGSKTASFPRLQQRVGRCMRPKNGPGYILDHTGNYDEHQWLPTDHIDWSLSGEVRKPKEIKAIVCPHCLFTGYPQNHVCTNCGGNVTETLRAAAERQQIEIIEGELAEIARADHEASKVAATLDRKRTIASLTRAEEIIAYGERMGYKKGWAKKLIEVKRERGRLVA